MKLSDKVKNYIKEFYVVTYAPSRKMIFISDINENCLKEPLSIYLGNFKNNKVILSWGKINEITGIDYHHKNFVSDLTELFSDIYRNKKTRDFFETLILENLHVSLEINEVIEYFPNLD